MGIFSHKKSGGVADVIRCDEPSYLIWKWHPNAYNEGDLKRETSIRTNSILHVKDGEVAVFVYKQKDGTCQDFIEGPFEETIKTKNFPVLSSVIGLWYEGDTPFQAEVYFINIANIIQIRFGVPYFNVVDPRYPDYDVPVAVRGTLSFKITDYKAFIKCNRLVTFGLEDFKAQVTDAICRYVKDAVAKAPLENNIPVISIESKIDLINDKAEMNVKDRFIETFGVTVTGLDINAIEVDKESDAYLELKKITKEMTGRQAEINIKHYEESLRIQREEEQFAQHMASKQNNLGAYQTEIQGNVGVAGANALAEMGKNGVGNINMGGDGGNAGFNPMTLGVGIAVGSAVGQNIAGTINSSMQPASNSVPPALPKITYHVAVNNQPTGPFEDSQIRQMIANGQIKPDTLLWKQGTPAWARADAFNEFQGLFPPTLPMM